MQSLDRARFRINEFLAGRAAGGGATARVARRALNAVNDLLGEPICSPVELARRRGEAVPRGPAAREAAPVFLYVTWDSPDRAPVEDLLKARRIEYRVLDVGRDPAMLSMIKTRTGGEPPVAFVGDHAVGWIDELTRLAESGELDRLVRGDGAP